MKTVINSRDAKLLSNYLDHQLNSQQCARLEVRLRQDEELHRFYETMRRTHLMLRQLSPHRVPRNFTIDRENISSTVQIPTFQTVLRFSSALAAFALIIVFALDYLFLSRTAPLVESVQSIAPQVIFRDEKIVSPPIITWGNPALMNGIGGGGGSPAQPGMITAYEIPDELEVQVSEEVIPSAPQVELSTAAPPPSPQEEILSIPQPEMELESVIGTGPFLGILPAVQRGQIIARFPILPVTESRVSEFNLRWIEIILAVITLVLGTMAIILGKIKSSVLRR